MIFNQQLGAGGIRVLVEWIMGGWRTRREANEIETRRRKVAAKGERGLFGGVAWRVRLALSWPSSMSQPSLTKPYCGNHRVVDVKKSRLMICDIMDHLGPWRDTQEAFLTLWMYLSSTTQDEFLMLRFSCLIRVMPAPCSAIKAGWCRAAFIWRGWWLSGRSLLYVMQMILTTSIARSVSDCAETYSSYCSLRSCGWGTQFVNALHDFCNYKDHNQKYGIFSNQTLEH